MSDLKHINQALTEQARADAAVALGADKLPEIMRAAYEQDRREHIDLEAIDEKRREREEISERAHNCPRGEFR